METIQVSTVQFENRSGDKTYNLSIMEDIVAAASGSGSQVISFHECCISGYGFARKLSKEALLGIAEYIPNGPSIARLEEMARRYNIAILAGLFEKDQEGNVYNAYVCVDQQGLVAKHRKLHPFISSFLSAGNQYTVFPLLGWTCGILICYDNNIIENVRATALLGADIIFMPHVTMCTPSTRPGAGFVDPALWKTRHLDPALLQEEFDGAKGREWLMKWLPARAYDNGVYAVFANPIGMEDDQLKNGCSMILDPFGAIMVECRNFGNQFLTAKLSPESLTSAGGFRYRNARRPDLYREIIGSQHPSSLQVSWLQPQKTGHP